MTHVANMTVCFILDACLEHLDESAEAPPIVQSFARRSGKPVDDVMALWKRAKAIAKEQGFTEADGERFYKFKVGALKRMLKISETFDSEGDDDAAPEMHEAIADYIGRLSEATGNDPAMLAEVYADALSHADLYDFKKREDYALSVTKAKALGLVNESFVTRWENEPVGGTLAAFVRRYGTPKGGDSKQAVSWIGSKLNVPHKGLQEAHARSIRAGLSQYAAVQVVAEVAYRTKDEGEDFINEIDSRRDALLAYIMQTDGKVSEFEAWLRENYPALAKRAEPLTEVFPDQVYNVPNAITAAAVSGTLATRGQGVSALALYTASKLAEGRLCRSEVESLATGVWEGSARECVGGSDTIRWAMSVFAKGVPVVAESRRDRKPDDSNERIKVPESVVTAAKEGLRLREFTSSASVGGFVTANLLARGKRVSKSKVRHIHRNAPRAKAEEGTTAYTEVMLWGGPEVRAWTAKVLRQI